MEIVNGAKAAGDGIVILPGASKIIDQVSLCLPTTFCDRLTFEQPRSQRTKHLRILDGQFAPLVSSVRFS